MTLSDLELRHLIQVELANRARRNKSHGLRAFTPEEASKIRLQFLNGAEVRELSKEWQVGTQTLRKVLNGQHPYTYNNDPLCQPFNK